MSVSDDSATPRNGADDALLRVVAAGLRTARSVGERSWPIGVAVSGGGDSVALLHLMHRVTAASGVRLAAVTVDHGLRPESAAEADGVARFCATLGIPHDTIRWSGPARTGNLMDQARHARRLLIADWARGQGISHVALGHTADDQAETFLMNLAREAGLDGLCGLRPAWPEHGVTWMRPLLHWPREGLRTYLRRHAVDWVEDPTNEDVRFTRARARQVLKALAPLGITVDGLNATMMHLGLARSAVVAALARAVVDHVTMQAGGVRIALSDLHMLGAEVERRMLIAILRWMNGAAHPPRGEKLLNLQDALSQGRGATLGGVWFQQREGMILACREPRAAMEPVPMGQVWDNRWRVTGPVIAGARIAALGAEGLRQLPDWRRFGVPRDAALVTPGIWAEDQLVAAPALSERGEWRAELTPSLHSFILSH